MPDIPSPKDALNAVNEFLALPGSAADLTNQGAGGQLNPLNRPRKRRIKASQLYVEAGGKQEDAQFMGEVAVGESHCNNRATSWTGCCHCIWQIHELHYQKLGYKSKEEFVKAIKDDPMECARAAVAVMNSQGRGAWEGTKYVGTGRDCSVTVKGKSLNQSIADVGADLNPIDDVAGAITAVFKPIGDFFKIITDPATWQRVGKVLLGALLLLIAIQMLTGGALGRTVTRSRGRTKAAPKTEKTEDNE